MLNFKVNELKLMCKNLKLANSKLAERIDELERPRSEIISENSVEVNRTQDLTMMQQEFSEIEEELKIYKSQLARYQQTNSQQLQAKRDEINRYKSELEDARMEGEDLMRELKEKNRIISLLENKNEELLLLVEELESDKEREDDYYMGRGRSRRDNNFNDKISSEMENMIDKLVKELKYEKRNSAKQITEIKRLNGEVLDLENKIKEKNNKIYELEMNLIKQAKQQPSLKERSPIKFEKYDKYENESSHSYKQDEPLNSYLPQRNNNFIQAFRQDPDIPYKDVPTSKNKSHLTNKSYNKNRVSA
jgi:chromosome segregation ATPase